MSTTSHLNIINIPVIAEDQMIIDQSTGTYGSNIDSDAKYYFWSGDHQTIPLGMNGNPEKFVDRMASALPTVNCLRIAFNKNSFNPDGSLHEYFERFLVAAANKGYQIIMLLADGGASGFSGTANEARSALNGGVFEDMKSAWASMMNWMSDHEDVKEAVYGWELANEPAAYSNWTSSSRAETVSLESEFVELYVNHMKELGEIINAESNAKILIDLFGYAGQSEILGEKILGGRSAIDLLREAFSEDLVWSAHFYAGWRGTGDASSPDQIISELQKLLSPLGEDDIILSETNAPGDSTFNPYATSQSSSVTALAFEWLTQMGVAIGWFPGVQTGASNLATIWGNGTINYLHQTSLAAALNAFSFGDTENYLTGTAFDGVTRLVSARLRNEGSDPDYQLKKFDAVDFAGFAFGAANADSIVGHDLANNFLYGGAGNDTIIGAMNDDYLFGQNGNDVIRSGKGYDYLFGGDGQDTLIAEGQFCRMYGGNGADTFVISDKVDAEIVDFNLLEGDRWKVSLESTVTSVHKNDVNNDDSYEQIVTFSNDLSVVLFFDTSSANSASIYSFSPSAGFPAGLDTEGSNLSFGDSTPDRMEASDGQATLFGGAADDTLVGGDQGDALYGGADADQIRGADSSDTLFGDTGNDSLYGGKGKDVLISGQDDDWLFGGASADRLVGGVGADKIIGGVGSDFLRGGRGNDVLWGGDNADVFFFTSGDGRDSIEDFNPYFDTIQFCGVKKSEISMAIRQEDCLITYDGGRIVLHDIDRINLVANSFEFV